MIFKNKNKKQEQEQTSSQPPDPKRSAEGKRVARGLRVRTSWRQRMSISSLLLGTVLITLFIMGALVGAYSINVVYKNKLRDTWAILFLDLESQANRILSKLESFHASKNLQSGQTIKPDVALRVVDSTKFTKVYGDFPGQVSAEELYLSKTRLDDDRTVLQFSGEEFLTIATSHESASRLLGQALPNGAYFLLWKVSLENWLNDSIKDVNRNTLYIVNKQGRLLFSNDTTIKQNNYIERNLVQKFISLPLNQGQVEFVGPSGEAYGFFSEVPGTNIILFTETLKSIALSSVRELALHVFLVLMFILGVVGLLLQFPLTALIAPIKELVRLASEIGSGEFNVHPKQDGFGELKVLSSSFTEMAKSLMVRDERINLLLIEHQEKLRLVNELTIAKSIQKNFLLKGKLPPGVGLDVAAQYIPAEQVAGDWYSYFHHEVTGESVFAIADVSGHGAGSAMFTAIIAATFEEARIRSLKLATFPMEDYLKWINRLIIKLGHGDVHVTMLMVKHKAKTESIELVNSGHTFPLLIPPKDSGRMPESIVVRSDILGVFTEYNPKKKNLSFPKGTGLLMYTDGLIEGRPDNVLYRDRRLSKAAQIEVNQAAKQIIDNVYDDWVEHLEGQSAKDDLCLLAIKAAA